MGDSDRSGHQSQLLDSHACKSLYVKTILYILRHPQPTSSCIKRQQQLDLDVESIRGLEGFHGNNFFSKARMDLSNAFLQIPLAKLLQLPTRCGLFKFLYLPFVSWALPAAIDGIISGKTTLSWYVLYIGAWYILELSTTTIFYNFCGLCNSTP